MDVRAMGVDFLDQGNVTSPRGYQAAGVVAGLKRSGAPDVALLTSDVPAVAAAAFTSNRFPAAPVIYDREVLDRTAGIRAVYINSGNANACTGPAGLTDAARTAEHVAQCLGVPVDSVLVCSTGRIGVPLPMDKIMAGVERAVAALAPDGGHAAAEAIMTTDTRPKEAAVKVQIEGCEVVIGGMAKGAGMIAPRLRMHQNQATMLAYVTTDAAVSPAFLQDCLDRSLDASFNRITVDGDTSTNDTVILLANGGAGNTPLDDLHPAADTFREALRELMGRLAREMVLDGEGVTRFVELCVSGATSNDAARMAAEAIANSALCKTAWFGADPNWGRILCAAGYSGADLDPNRVSLDYGGVPIVQNGVDAGTPEADQVAAIDKREFRIDLDLGVGDGRWTIWTCDVTYEYVRINADYHT